MTHTHSTEIIIGPAVASGVILAATFTPTEITALTMAIVALLTAAFTGAVNIITALRSERKVDEVNAKADVITGHVNSAATEAKVKIEALDKEVKMLQQLITDQKQTAALLAQAAATPPTISTGE